jgi:hypothetical protein
VLYPVGGLCKFQRRPDAPGLTPRVVLEKLAAMQLLDVHFPTTDGRELVFTRYTQPEADQQLLLAQLGWGLPEQARPGSVQNPRSLCSTDLSNPTIEFTRIFLAYPPQ